jgi:hypothetical protein
MYCMERVMTASSYQTSRKTGVRGGGEGIMPKHRVWRYSGLTRQRGDSWWLFVFLGI